MGTEACTFAAEREAIQFFRTTLPLWLTRSALYQVVAVIG
jgi:hypothetical protein